jgi:hypothetical protein
VDHQGADTGIVVVVPPGFPAVRGRDRGDRKHSLKLRFALLKAVGEAQAVLERILQWRFALHRISTIL